MEGLWRFRPSGSISAFQREEETLLVKETGITTYRWPEERGIIRQSNFQLRLSLVAHECPLPNSNPSKEIKTRSKSRLPSITLILRESVLGLKGRPSSCRLTLNGAPLRTTKALELLKSSVLCLCMFSDFSRLTFCTFKTANEERNGFFLKTHTQKFDCTKKITLYTINKQINRLQ